jgi:hypothetical protein
MSDFAIGHHLESPPTISKCHNVLMPDCKVLATLGFKFHAQAAEAELHAKASDERSRCAPSLSSVSRMSKPAAGGISAC